MRPTSASHKIYLLSPQRWRRCLALVSLHRFQQCGMQFLRPGCAQPAPTRGPCFHCCCCCSHLIWDVSISVIPPDLAVLFL
jgi:hypothetical protein